MGRDFFINGETMVNVKLSPERSPAAGQTLYNLGLASDSVKIMPRFIHHEIKTDAFGPEIPAELMWLLADITIQMSLVHYDKDVLDACLTSSMAGGGWAGDMAKAGTLMGRSKAVGENGNSYIRLSLLSPIAGAGWRFRSAYLANKPVEIPLGTGRSIALCNWRAIPYSADGLDSGIPIFDRNPDTLETDLGI